MNVENLVNKIRFIAASIEFSLYCQYTVVQLGTTLCDILVVLDSYWQMFDHNHVHFNGDETIAYLLKIVL